MALFSYMHSKLLYFQCKLFLQVLFLDSFKLFFKTLLWEICMQVKKQQLELDMEQNTG